MPKTPALYDVTSLVSCHDTGEKAMLESLLALTPDGATLTLRVPGCRRVFVITVCPEQAHPLREAVRQAYQMTPAR